MENTKVVKINEESVEFDNGVELLSDHSQDCCEHHWLSFQDLSMDDFDGLEFNLESDCFFERVEGYGIRLIPVNGHPVSVAGYGSNNGYYSDHLDLVLMKNKKAIKRFDISECQDITA
jgi:hypothetical protein